MIIFNIYIAHIYILKLTQKLLLPLYNFEFTIKCEDVILYETLKRN